MLGVANMANHNNSLLLNRKSYLVLDVEIFAFLLVNQHVVLYWTTEDIIKIIGTLAMIYYGSVHQDFKILSQ